MKLYWVAFDIDNCLRRGDVETEVQADEDVRTLMRILHGMANVRVLLWSGGGELYARQMAKAMHVTQWIHEYGMKGCRAVDLTIDDERDMSLGKINLLVRGKAPE